MRVGVPRIRRRALRLPSTRPPLRRILWTLGQLRAGRPLKAGDLAARFEVGVRTAYRDLDFLRDELHVPLEYDRPHGSWSLTEPTAPLPPVLLSEGELVALYFAEKVVGQYQGTPFEEDVASAFRKLQALLPEEVVVRPERILSFMEIDPGPLPRADPAVFRDVLAGLTRRRRLEVRYASASSGRTLDRTVDPYRILSVGGTWYLVAWDARRRAVRDFALHRIRKVALTDEPFQVSEGFNLDRYRADAFRTEKGGRPLNVAIRFSPLQARWIRERTWHRSARIQDRLDGGCILRLRVAPTGDLVRWVLQYGPEAEVLAPKALRAEVARQAAETLATYRASQRPRKESDRAGR